MWYMGSEKGEDFSYWWLMLGAGLVDSHRARCSWCIVMIAGRRGLSLSLCYTLYCVIRLRFVCVVEIKLLLSGLH